jgi:hypothetical protein
MSLPRPTSAANLIPAISQLIDQLEQSGGSYTPTNVTTDRAFDADTVTVAELADVVGTLIADLKKKGLLT